MILGFVKIEDGAVITHRDSYLIDHLKVVSVRRPFAGAGIIGGIALTSFAAGFYDLLYASELITLGLASAISLIIGREIGQLKLISRETKGTELAGAIWGRATALQTIRALIVKELRARPAARAEP